MAFAFDEIFAYGGQLIVAAKKVVPKALGIGEEKIDHSAYIQGNTQIGKPDAFSSAAATLMVGREDTKGTPNAIGTLFFAATISCPPYENISSNANAMLDTL